MRRQYREATGDEIAQIWEDVVFEIEPAGQDEVNVDSMLILVDKKRGFSGDEDRDIRADIERSLEGSPSLRNKNDLVL